MQSIEAVFRSDRKRGLSDPGVKNHQTPGCQNAAEESIDMSSFVLAAVSCHFN